MIEAKKLFRFILETYVPSVPFMYLIAYLYKSIQVMTEAGNPVGKKNT